MPGVSGTPGGTNQSVLAGASGIASCMLEKDRQTAGCARATPPSKFWEILCDFSSVYVCAPFLLHGYTMCYMRRSTLLSKVETHAWKMLKLQCC